MPVYSIEQWREVVGVMAAIAASKKKNPKTHEKKEFQKQKTKFRQWIMWMGIFLFILSRSLAENGNRIEDTVPTEYCPCTKPQN